MNLTGKQKRELKARGQTMGDDARLGKAGITPSFVQHMNGLLAQRDLVKLRFTDVEGKERKAFADQVSAAVNAQCISVLGRTMLLYRPKPDVDA